MNEMILNCGPGQGPCNLASPRIAVPVTAQLGAGQPVSPATITTQLSRPLPHQQRAVAARQRSHLHGTARGLDGGRVAHHARQGRAGVCSNVGRALCTVMLATLCVVVSSGGRGVALGLGGAAAPGAGGSGAGRGGGAQQGGRPSQQEGVREGLRR